MGSNKNQALFCQGSNINLLSCLEKTKDFLFVGKQKVVFNGAWEAIVNIGY